MDSEGNSLGVDAASAGRDGAVIEAVDPFAADEPVVSEAVRRGWTREQAIAHGRRLAEDECVKLAKRRADFTAQDRLDRIARAEAYAAWEYDGRAVGTIGKRLP